VLFHLIGLPASFNLSRNDDWLHARRSGNLRSSVAWYIDTINPLCAEPCQCSCFQYIGNLASQNARPRYVAGIVCVWRETTSAGLRFYACAKFFLRQSCMRSCGVPVKRNHGQKQCTIQRPSWSVAWNKSWWIWYHACTIVCFL
jgi:hypothetical protein